MSWADDLQADVELWVPYMAVEFPGSGITPFTVDDLTFWWWRIFRARASELAEFQKKQAKEAKRRVR